MKFYNSMGPNPHMVRMFAAEKGITLPMEEVDLRAGDNRKEPHLSRNPHGQMPALELDNGSFLSEVVPICGYLEEKHPSPPLIGTTAEERAECRMWTRRLDLNICEMMGNGFRYGEAEKFFAKRIVTVPEASAGLKKVAADRIAWLDKQMDGKEYICGKRFTMADILLYCLGGFFAKNGQTIDPANKNVLAWFERVKARPSSNA